MKTTSRLLFFLLAVVSLVSCKNQLHVVTLYVDTDQIQLSNTDQHANFGQPLGISNTDFTTHVRKGDRVIWQGVSISNPADQVKITSINYVSGERLFQRISLSGKRGGDEMVTGAIKMRPGKFEAYLKEKYSINFTLSNKAGTFNIDPVIKAYR